MSFCWGQGKVAIKRREGMSRAEFYFTNTFLSLNCGRVNGVNGGQWFSYRSKDINISTYRLWISRSLIFFDFSQIILGKTIAFSCLTVVLRNRARSITVPSQRGLRPSWLFRKVEQNNCFIIQNLVP